MDAIKGKKKGALFMVWNLKKHRRSFPTTENRTSELSPIPNEVSS